MTWLQKSWRSIRAKFKRMKHKSGKEEAATPAEEQQNPQDTPDDPAERVDGEASQPSSQPPLQTHESMEQSVNTGKEKISARELWLGKFDFFLSVMGFNIGLGNMLRFPYLVGKNGGAAFLIPYFLLLFTLGVPLFFIEMALGQYSGRTPLLFWGNIAPLCKGMGWCHALGCGMYNIYYMVLMAWILFYLVASCFPKLGWAFCNPAWASKCCAVLTDSKWNNSECAASLKKSPNDTSVMAVPASREYLEKYVLQLTKGFEYPGTVNWRLAVALIVSWIIVYLCLLRGVRTMGRVVYVTALIPYLFLTILLIRGVLMPGSGQGVRYYIVPQWKSLLNGEVWLDAAQQIFWSLAPTWGITITLACRNTFKHNIYRDALVLPVVSALTSFFGGFVTFSFTGAMAFQMRQNVSEFVAKSIKPGPALAFVIYPAGLAKLEVPQLWCVVFFALLVSLGLDSAFTSFDTFYQSIVDEYPNIFKKKEWLSKVLFTLLSLVLGLPLVTQGGFYLYQVVDWYQVNFFMLIALVEVIVVCYCYGYDHFEKNVEQMTSQKILFLWRYHLKFILPAILLTMFIMTMVTFSSVSYGNYKYPRSAIALGWLVAVSNIVAIPIYAVYKLISTFLESKRSQRPFLPAVKLLLKPTKEWEEERRIAEYQEENIQFSSGQGAKKKLSADSEQISMMADGLLSKKQTFPDEQ